MLDGELNLAKAELHYHGDKSGKGIIRRIREAIDPEAAEMVYAAASMQKARGLTAMAQEIMKLGVPSSVAYVWAYETKRGADRLTNFSGTLDKALDQIDEGKAYFDPSQEFMGNFAPVAERASEDYARELLGKLLAGEMESPGSFSKRTLSILGDMSKADAEAFGKVCACCAGDKNSGLMPMLVGPGEPFELSLAEIETLNGLGLAEFPSGPWSTTGKAPISEWTSLSVGGRLYHLRKEQGFLEFQRWPLTKYGLELATLFELGNAPGFAEALVEKWKSLGIVVQEAFRMPGFDGLLFRDV
ncbi:MAG: DUF2806 domain-containing protein [Eggerthellaceae bacterium]|nr:DUF2806 domain-containing protein [Eggerthellaceae bacterium]